ncbi:MAG TPA: DUF839 domain-containing protein [Campylobacterales bacterium]|nr:DUF839 domain-containing protein [Campylobacterales bacterium]
MKKYLLLSIVAASALTFLGCSDSETTTPNTLSFSEAPIPTSDSQKRSILASQAVTVNGKEYPISYNTIIKSGDEVGGGTYGLIYDENGAAVTANDGSQKISNSNDFASLLPVGDKLFMISHFETRPAAMYLTELNQDKTTGKLTPKSTKNIDFTAFNGLWVPCAGSVTPWGTHLGSEEYPPDASSIDENGSISSYYDPMADYVGGDLLALNPYDYGWTPELKVSATGSVDVKKHYAMGRFAHELAYVMPDSKTVYLSDDGTNGVFYKFIADKAKDLSAGRLYAAKWEQTSGVGGGTANITWVDLGHATNAEIKAALDAKKTFGDIFTVASRNADNTCPSGFTASNWAYKNECLKIKDGMEVIASRLESGRYAGMKGATTEFSKMEGITYNPQNKEMYMAMSRTEKGMEDNKYKNKPETKYDKGGSNDIRLEKRNYCGVVYKMALDNGYNVTKMSTLIAGTPMEKDANGNSCKLDNISMPDNLTFIPNTDTLIIGEDTGYHQNDMIWAYNLTSKKLTRIQTTPYGSETTSPYYYPDINGFGYLMSVVQHPFGESDQDKLQNPDEKKAYTGYIGPFPVIK